MRLKTQYPRAMYEQSKLRASDEPYQAGDTDAKHWLVMQNSD